MDHEFIFVGDHPNELDEQLLHRLVDDYPGVLPHGMALALPKPDQPDTVWYVNRTIWKRTGLVYVLEAGQPLRMLTSEEIQSAVTAKVAALAATKLSHQQQINTLVDFVKDLVKGRIYAGS